MSKRQEEIEKIKLLKSKLAALKEKTAQSNTAVSEQQSNILLKRCQDVLDKANEVCTNAISRLETTTNAEKDALIASLKAQLAEQKANASELESQEDKSTNESNELSIQTLQKENAKLKAVLEKTKKLEVMRKQVIEKLKAEVASLKEENQSLLDSNNNNDNSKNNNDTNNEKEQPKQTSADELSNEPIHIDKLSNEELKAHFESKLAILESCFDSDEILARNLYKDISAEAFTNPVRVGFLVKQGGSTKNWKKRYFILQDNFLFYYKKKAKDEQPIGVIHLEKPCAVDEAVAEDVSKPNCFKITTKTRTWFFQADRQIEMDLWIICLKTVFRWYEFATVEKKVALNFKIRDYLD